MLTMDRRRRRDSVGVGDRVLLTVALGACVLGAWSAPAWAGTWTAFVASTACSPAAAAVHGLASSRHVAAAAAQTGCPSGQQAGGLLTPIDLGLGPAGPSLLSAPPSPVGVAVTPDGRYALVAGAGGLVRDGLGDQSVTTIGLPGASSQDALGFVAISPDGSMAYASDPGAGVVWPVSGLEGSSPTVGQAVSVGPDPEGVAFSPDGSTVYVASNGGGMVSGSVTPITVSSDLAQAAIVGVGHPFGIAMTPDGSSAYVTDSAGNQVYPIAIGAGNTVGSPIAVGSDPRGIAISADGTRAYVADYGAGAGNQVTPISGLGGSPSAGTPITLEPGAAPVDLALAPDGSAVYVSDAGTNDVTPVTGLPASPSAGTPIQLVGVDAQGIAITPDQAPSASFTVTGAAPGQPTSFDASASSSPVGTIASYTWSFGDGSQPVTTTGATTSHVYSAGTYTARLTVTNIAGTSTTQAFTGQTVSREGGPSATATHLVNMAGPTVQIAPSSVTFGATQVGSTSAVQTVTVTNTGNADLHVAGAALGGAQPGDFALTGDQCSAQTVPAGRSCTVAVSFRPTANGARQAQLQFTDDAPASPQTVPLSGTGGSSPTVQIAPSSVAFGATQVGSTSVVQTVTVTNSGNADLHVAGAALGGAQPGDFALTGDQCSAQTVPAGQSCTVAVSFRPTANGARQAQLQFTDDAPASPQTVPLSGTGGSSPTVQIAPSSVAFGATQVGSTSVVQTVTVTNSGNADLHVSGAALGGAQPGDFALTGDHCSAQTVPAGQSCTVAVSFRPTANGARQAQLQLIDDAPASPQTVPLSGTGFGAGAPGVQVSPASLMFASTQTGQTSPEQTVSVTNTGNAGLHVSGAALAGAQPGDFALASDHCSGQTLPAGQSCSAEVRFSPLGPGNRQAQLLISDDATGSPQIVTLTGSGAGPPVPASPPPGLATLYGQVSPPFTEIQLRSSDGTRFTGFGGNRIGGGGGHFQQIAPGDYEMVGLPPGTYRVEGFAFAQGAVNYVTQVTLAANTSTRLDLTLRAANGLHGGLSITNADGTGVTGTTGKVYPYSPFQLHIPVQVPRSPPRTIAETTYTLSFGPQSTVPGETSTATLSMLYYYDDSGVPLFLEAVPGNPLAPAPAPTNAAGSWDVSQSGAGLSTGQALTAAVTRTAHRASFDSAGNIFLEPTFTPTVQDGGNFELSVSPHVTLIQHVGDESLCPDGTTAVLRPSPDKDASILSLKMTLEAEQREAVAIGRRLGEPGSVTSADFVLIPLINEIDRIQVELDNDAIFDCIPVPADPDAVYVDPSGRVTTTDGVPVAHAQVRLQRSSSRTGRFMTPPAGSTTMSPANRRNPDFTDRLGLFGWDVIPGFYRVHASHPGCRAAHHPGQRVASTPVSAIPPAVTNLVLVLDCPNLRRASTRLELAYGTLARTLSATVVGRGSGRPVGTITFRRAGRTLAIVPLDRAHAMAITGPTGTIAVTYSGDGRYAPSRARFTLRSSGRR